MKFAIDQLLTFLFPSMGSSFMGLCFDLPTPHLSGSCRAQQLAAKSTGDRRGFGAASQGHEDPTLKTCRIGLRQASKTGQVG